MVKLLNLAHDRLGWPARKDIFNPKGAGPKVLAKLANDKIGLRIRNIDNCGGAKVSIVSANPFKDSTEAPVAIICEFQRPVSHEVLLKAQKLAWNFSLAPQLITVEPNIIRSFTCCELPDDMCEDASIYQIEKVSREELESDEPLVIQAARSLHWIQMVSGELFNRHESRFKRNKRADQMLLSNLQDVRDMLLEENVLCKRVREDKKFMQKIKEDETLSKQYDQEKELEDICHDLLARVIFIQFLWDRKDSKGRAALDEKRLESLYDEGILSKKYGTFGAILKSKKDTYAFFRCLDQKFNGDLFSGSENKDSDTGKRLENEMRRIKQKEHLSKLADFVSGKLSMRDGQYCLWRHYSFDIIPLEFISSIYEEFLSEEEKDTGAHYTPPHIVDFLLDGVLPWDSKRWDLKILDPACGSGIFLVKAYQRLVYRWKNSHKRQIPKPEILRGLLEKNIFGVDINPHAVRVASFSLYLAMCDEIEPMSLWLKKVKFPSLRNKRLVSADFFKEGEEGFCTKENKAYYNLIIGNAPWGHAIATDSAKKWSHENEWPLANKNPGPLFLAKSAALTKKNGQVSMLQPFKALLTNLQSPAINFRRKLFESFNVEEVVNLAALRFGLFKGAISPACIITFRPTTPKNEPIIYICPKPTRHGSEEDDYLLVIEPYDINYIYNNEALKDHLVWTTLMWGNRRDYLLIKKLGEYSKFSGITNKEFSRKGVVIGSKKRDLPELKNRRILSAPDFPRETFMQLNTSELSVFENPKIDHKDGANLKPFDLPQMVIKKSWKADKGRFTAVIVNDDIDSGGCICTQSYVTMHVDSVPALETACTIVNSLLANYYLFLTSGSCAAYIPSANVVELLSMPIPDLMEIPSFSEFEDYDVIDKATKKAFSLDEAEWAMIDDFTKYTLQDFKRGRKSLGREITTRQREPELNQYCNYFHQNLKAGFGEDKKVSFSIFCENSNDLLPVRMVAIYLNNPNGNDIRMNQINTPDLLNKLRDAYSKLIKNKSNPTGGVCYQRVIRIYDLTKIGGQNIPTIYIIKPDQKRYWTRSIALRDADEVADDIMFWDKTYVPIPGPKIKDIQIIRFEEGAICHGEKQS